MMSCHPTNKKCTLHLTRWKLHRVWFSNGSDLLRGFATDVLALETEFCRGSWLRELQYEGSEKKYKEEAKADDGTEEEQEVPVPPVTHVKNISQLIFSNGWMYINNQQVYLSNGLYVHKSHIPNDFKGAIHEYKGVLHCKGYDYGEFLDEIMEVPLPTPFSTRRLETLSTPDACILYSSLNCYFKIWKLGYD